MSVGTTYLPPERAYLPFPDIHKIVSNNHPSYLIGNLNAKHTSLGDQTNNAVGRRLNIFLLEKEILYHILDHISFLTERGKHHLRQI